MWQVRFYGVSEGSSQAAGGSPQQWEPDSAAAGMVEEGSVSEAASDSGSEDGMEGMGALSLAEKAGVIFDNHFNVSSSGAISREAQNTLPTTHDRRGDSQLRWRGRDLAVLRTLWPG